jgi:GNAT superfamily N-acetyltransferase
MATTIGIEASKPDDVAEILRLIRGLAEYEKLLHKVVATEADLRDSLFGAQPAGECLIARADGRAIGLAIYFRNLSTFVGKPGLYLEDLFVEPAYRGKGIGGALLRAVARIAVDRGYARVDWSVLDWNAPAIRFYKSIGALPIDEWTIFRLQGEALTGFVHGKKAHPEQSR